MGIVGCKMNDIYSEVDRPDNRSEAEKFADQEATTREHIRHNERMQRLIDYTPIYERDSPCMNWGKFCVQYGEHGCFRYGGKHETLKGCPKWKEWAIRKKIINGLQ